MRVIHILLQFALLIHVRQDIPLQLFPSVRGYIDYYVLVQLTPLVLFQCIALLHNASVSPQAHTLPLFFLCSLLHLDIFLLLL